ncbi:NAD(P)H-binding protein OS=Streptomyces tendae OX=1932 GN=GUR47_11475 PE=4 SV=1 [Streptomyces tendae]
MIVVTGATGNIGRPLTRALAEAGEQVTAVSRHPAAVPDGVRHMVADLAEPAGLRPALAGAKSLFLLLSGDLHARGAEPADLIGEAADSGVRRIVLLSTLGVVTRPFGATRIAMRALEDTLRASGLDRPSCGPAASPPTHCGGPSRPRPTGRRRALRRHRSAGRRPRGHRRGGRPAAEDPHTGGAYELTRPEVITPRGQTEAIAAALGAPVAFHELTRDEARAAMARSMPAELADDTLDILGNPSPAELRVSPDVERVLGRALALSPTGPPATSTPSAETGATGATGRPCQVY